VSKVLGLGARERLGETVGGHVLGRTINKLDRAIFDRVADEMPLDVDMFNNLGSGPFLHLARVLVPL
jgi:hypothetical protein